MSNQNDIERNHNQHITAFLDYYLNECQNPDYAVLITGCWGSGKSYFIRKYLAGKACVKDFLTDAEKYRVIYVTLFGAKTRAEMDQRVFEKLHPILSSRGMKLGLNAVQIVSRMLPVVSGAAVQGVAGFSENFIESQKKNPEKKVVIVFDDVERADMPVPELLGYLNEYVEHLHIPCILVADQERWEEAKTCQEDKATLHSLSSTQEKVIGKTFQIQTEPKEVLDCWLNGLPDCCPIGDRAKKILAEHEPLLIQILEASEKHNYRAFKHTLQDFELFIGRDSKDANVLDEQLAQDEFCRLFLADFVCMQYQFYLNLFTSEELGEENKDLRLASQLTDSKEVIPLTPWEKANVPFKRIERLLPNTGDDRERWIEIWKQWLSQHWVDPAELQTLIKESIWFEGQYRYWLNKIANWTSLNDEEGKKVLDAFYEALQNRLLLKPNKLQVLFCRLNWYAQKGALTENAGEFYNKMVEYVESVKDKLEYETLWSLEKTDEYASWYNAYPEENGKFRNVLETALKLKKDERQREWQTLFCEMLQSESQEDQDKACRLIAGTADGLEFFDFPHIDVDKFLNSFLNVKSWMRSMILESLKERYDAISSHPSLLDEKSFLECLRDAAQRKFDSFPKPLPPSIFSLYNLNQTINKILQESFQGKKGDA